MLKENLNKPTTVKLSLEKTDTFAGEANYCWVNRAVIECQDTQWHISRAVKEWAGWTGIKCELTDYGDTQEYRPRGICQVLFVSTADNDAEVTQYV